MCARGHSAFETSRRECDHGSLRAPVPGGIAEASDKGKRDRKLRADVFEMPANAGKAQALFDLWPLWRRGLLAELIVARRDMLAGRRHARSSRPTPRRWSRRSPPQRPASVRRSSR